MLAAIVTIAYVGMTRASHRKGFFSSPCQIQWVGEKWEEATQEGKMRMGGKV